MEKVLERERGSLERERLVLEREDERIKRGVMVVVEEERGLMVVVVSILFL